MNRRRTLQGLITCSLMHSFPRVALAQGTALYPNHAIRLIVPLAAGGGTDLVSRLVAIEMGKKLGVTIAVENVSGGGGVIGTSVAVRSAPDGYTLLTGTPSLSVNPSLRPDLSFDPVKDLAPISMLSRVPYILVASLSSGLRSVEEVLKRARRSPGLVTYGSPGIGTGGHMAGELFQLMADIKLMHVPYKGSGPAMNDVRAGRVDLLFGTTPLVAPLLSTHVVSPLAITSLKRSSLLPELPTISQSGVPDFEASSWYSLFAPAHTPPEILEKLNSSAHYALTQPRVLQAIESDGGEPEPTSRAQLTQFLNEEIQKWRKVIVAANIQVQ